MDFHLHVSGGRGGSPSSPASSTASSTEILSQNSPQSRQNGANSHTNTTSTTNNDHMHSWWESISKARTRIHILSNLLPESSSTLSSLADSDRPAHSLLRSSSEYYALSSYLSSPSSGSGDDPLCQWLYETFTSSDPDLRLVVLSYIPLITSLYLSRIHSFSNTSDIFDVPSLAGFEAVLLALYSSEVKSRSGKPILVSIPDLSLPSLYHTPKSPISSKTKPNSNISTSRPVVGVLSPPLEPQMVVKSTKRGCIVGVALDCFHKQISKMPSWSKVDFCKFAADWTGQDCPCTSDYDDDITIQKPSNFIQAANSVVDEIDDVTLEIGELDIIEGKVDLERKGVVRIPLPWELFQPVVRIIGHCLLGPLNTDEVKDAASVAVRRLYARASHDLNPQAILATRSLLQLDKRARDTAPPVANAASNANTPSKAKKPEIFLASK